MEALPEPGAALAADVAASSAAVVRVVAPIAGSVADASALFVVFSRRLLSVAQVSDGPDPVFAGVSGVPGLASAEAFPAVVGISDLASHSRCWVGWGVLPAEGPWDGL